MSTGFILAWMVGEGLMIFNDVHRHKRPPLPAELLSTSGLFVLLALLGNAAPTLAALLAWGFDIAAFLALYSLPPDKRQGTPGTPVVKPKKG